MSDTQKSLPLVDLLPTSEAGPADKDSLSLESLILLITVERLRSVKDKTYKELKELKERQEKVRSLHELLRTINAATDEKSKLDITSNDEIKGLIKKAKELGVEIKEDKFKYTKEERERLVDNIKMAAEDYEVENEMQLQMITRLTNDRYESYQMARSILRPLHEDKQRKAREISGRG